MTISAAGPKLCAQRTWIATLVASCAKEETLSLRRFRQRNETGKWTKTATFSYVFLEEQRIQGEIPWLQEKRVSHSNTQVSGGESVERARMPNLK